MSPEIEILNLENEICPYTLIYAVQKAEEIKEDLDSGRKILQVIVEHPPVIDNFPDEFGRRGYRVEIEKVGSAQWTVNIQK